MQVLERIQVSNMLFNLFHHHADLKFMMVIHINSDKTIPSAMIAFPVEPWPV
jgi:hypothetical protein